MDFCAECNHFSVSVHLDLRLFLTDMHMGVCNSTSAARRAFKSIDWMQAAPRRYLGQKMHPDLWAVS
jgi:hypothetical protein